MSNDSTAVQVFRINGINTRKYKLAIPMPHEGFFWEIGMNTKRQEDIVSGALAGDKWIAEMITELVVNIPGIYSVRAEDAYSITISLQLGLRWTDFAQRPDGESATIQEHVARVLARHLKKATDLPFTHDDFMRRAVLRSNLAMA